MRSSAICRLILGCGILFAAQVWAAEPIQPIPPWSGLAPGETNEAIVRATAAVQAAAAGVPVLPSLVGDRTIVRMRRGNRANLSVSLLVCVLSLCL
jgi:hypothetical protein